MRQPHTKNAVEGAGLEPVLREFDQQWQAGHRPDIEQFLPLADESSATPAEWIGELAMIDLEYRWRRPADLSEPATVTTDAAGGKPLVRPLAEDYVRRFAQLKDDAKVLRDLVRQEYRVRHLWGDQPTHGSFRERFPALGDVLIDALRSVDEELQVEQPEPAERSTASKATGGTIGFGDGNNEVVPDAGQPKLSGQFGRYSILTKLGQGAMGDVHLAYDSKLERQVALKTPRLESKSRKEVVERFHREAKAAAQLRHPNICPVYDVGEIDGRLYLTMAYVEGETLSKHIDAADHLPATWIAKVIRGIASALAEAHRHGVVHRDLKPGNVMLDKNDQPVVTDFGLATLDVTSAEARLTATDAILGTPAYMSPEQLDKERGEIGPATDIYSLGVMLFEMLTGQLPFRGSLISVLRQIPDKQPPRPSEIHADVDHQLESLCLRMIAKDPGDRPRSMDEIMEAIDEMEFGNHSAKPGPKSSQADVKQLKARRVKPIVAIAIAALILGIAAWAVTLTFKTSKGTVEVVLGEGVGPDIQIEVKPIDGDRILIADASNNWKIEATPGGYIVQFQGNGNQFELNKKSVIVRRGKTELVRVTKIDDEPDREIARRLLELTPNQSVSLGIAVDGKHLENVTHIGQLPRDEFKIRQVFVDDTARLSNDSLADLSRLSELTDLKLRLVPNLSDAGMKHLSEISSLRNLDLFSVVLTEEGIRQIAKLTGLEYLRFNTRSDAGFQHLKALTNLAALEIVGIGTVGTELEHLRQLPNLTSLGLWGPGVRDNAISRVACELPRLRDLNLTSARITDEGLLCLGKFNTLELLVLHDTQVTDTGLAHLSSLPKLAHLNLEETKISDDGLKALSELKTLRAILLTGTRVSPQGIAAFQAEHPECQVSFEPEQGRSTDNPIRADVEAGSESSSNTLGMVFCWCPAGDFKMGSIPSWPAGVRHLDPVEVRITQGFWIGKHEVTQREWEAVMGTTIQQQWQDVWGTNLGHFGMDDQFPIAWVGYNEAKEFARLLTQQERAARRLPEGWEYRLPTEAEWEYACRAATDTATIYGNRPLNDRQANISLPGQTPPRSYTKTGSFPANDWGIHDMYGNVAEWTGDAASREFVGGKDPKKISLRDNTPIVVRGGHMGTRSDELTSSWRSTPSPNGQPYIGFRLVLAPATDERESHGALPKRAQ